MDNIESTYNCIKSLKETSDYHSRWEQIRAVYKPQIDTDLFDEDVQYTPHDYTGHCVNIYTIFDIILPAPTCLTTEQLFILNVSVIMHDIAMLIDPKNRVNHSEEAKKFILEEVLSKKESFLEAILTSEEATFIAEVVFGHCDIKNNDGEVALQTIPSLPCKNLKRGKMGIVNTRMLAGILRIADELDVNSLRVAGKNLIKRRIKEGSQPHWRQCELFGLPSISDDDKTLILLRPNEEQIIISGDLDNDIPLMVKVENKIQTELDMVNEFIFNSGCLPDWKFSKVRIYTDDLEINTRISKEKESINPLTSSIVNITKKDTKGGNLQMIDSPFLGQLVSDKNSERLEQLVIKNNMLKSGHYYIDNDRYARDWIETHGLLSNSSYIDELANMFTQHLSSLEDKISNIHIIGEGFPGIILASVLAFVRGYPFTYHIPHQYEENHSQPEKHIDVAQDSSIIIVTDVIVTGKTIKKTISSLIDTYGISNAKIIKIFTIFLRPPLGEESIIDKAIEDKIVCLNNSLPIEICQKEDCLFARFGLIEHKYMPNKEMI